MSRLLTRRRLTSNNTATLPPPRSTSSIVLLKVSPSIAPSALFAAPAIELSFPGSRSVLPRQEQIATARTNILRGNDPTKWTRNLANSESVRYPQLYSGIDLIFLIFHARTQLLEHDFELAAHADPSLIRLHFAPAPPIPTGELIVGQVHQRRPVAFQSIGGRTAEVIYAGSAPGLVAGVFQLNVRSLDNLSAGNQLVEITVGNATSPTGVTVAVALRSPI